MAELIKALRKGRGLRAFAWSVLAFMVLVILWGAIVRTSGSGNGCGNHWPLCNGDFVPRHPRLATVIEFTHRSMSGICTGLLAVLAAWIFWARPKGNRARVAVVWTCVLLLTEALLGALLVKGGYTEKNASNARVLVQCIHFSNTMLLLAAFSVTARWLQPPVALLSKCRSTDRVAVWLALLCTLIVGATGSVAALADTLFPSPSLQQALAQDFSPAAPLIVRMRWIHPASAAVAMACVLWLCFQNRSQRAMWLATLVGLQLMLGVIDVLLLAPAWMQVLHLLGADLFWIALVSFAADTFAPAKNKLPGLSAVRA